MSHYDPLAMYSPPRPGMEDVRPAGQTPVRINLTGTIAPPQTPAQLVRFLQHNGLGCDRWLAMSAAQKDDLVAQLLGVWQSHGPGTVHTVLSHDATNDAFVAWAHAYFPEAFLVTTSGPYASPADAPGYSVSVPGQGATNEERKTDAIRRIRNALDGACLASRYDQLYGPQAASTNINAKAPPTGASFAPVRLPAGHVAGYDPLAMYSPPRPGMEPAGQVRAYAVGGGSVSAATPTSTPGSRWGDVTSDTDLFTGGAPVDRGSVFLATGENAQLVQFLRHNGYDCAKWVSFDRGTKRGIVNGWLGNSLRTSISTGSALPQDSINQSFLRSYSFVIAADPFVRGYGGAIASNDANVTVRNEIISKIDHVIDVLNNACAAASYNQIYGPQAAATSIHAKASPTGASFAPVRQLPAGQVTVNTTAPTPYLGYLVALAAGVAGGYALRSQKKFRLA